METIKLFLLNTPWYVYVILVYLIKIGIKSIKTQTIHINKLFAIPCVFIFMSIDEVVGSLSFHLSYVIAFILGLIIGCVLGYLQFNTLITSVDKVAKTLQIKGSYSSLCLIVVTFCFKYYMGYTLAANPNLAIGQLSLLLFISTIFTGAFVGRLVIAICKLKQSVL